MNNTFIAYKNPSIVGTEAPGWQSYPPNLKYPAIYSEDLPTGRHGELSSSIQYPEKQLNAAANYVTQQGQGLAAYNLNSMQLPLVRMNPVDSTKVPVNGNLMRVVGRSVPEQYIGSAYAGSSIDAANPAGDLTRDPVLRAQQYDALRVMELTGRRIPQNAERYGNPFQPPGGNAPRPAPGPQRNQAAANMNN